MFYFFLLNIFAQIFKFDVKVARSVIRLIAIIVIERCGMYLERNPKKTVLSAFQNFVFFRDYLSAKSVKLCRGLKAYLYVRLS